MGFLDAFLGRTKTKGPAKKDRLFALSTAYVSMDAEHDIKSTGRAGIVFQPHATSDFDQIVREAEEILELTGEETGTKVETQEDSYGYRWVIVKDPDLEDLVVGVNAIKDALDTGGYGDRVLAAVFPFRDREGKPIYLLYNVKRGTWYPFVPAGGEQQRNTERELQIRAQLGNELPFEPELERWFPMWGVPV
jgi:hypothetical protein